MKNITPKTAEAPTITKADEAVAVGIDMRVHTGDLTGAATNLATYREEQVATAVAEYKRVLEEAESALHTIMCNTEVDAIKHLGYEHLAKDICDCATSALAAIAKLKQGE